MFIFHNFVWAAAALTHAAQAVTKQIVGLERVLQEAGTEHSERDRDARSAAGWECPHVGASELFEWNYCADQGGPAAWHPTTIGEMR